SKAAHARQHLVLAPPRHVPLTGPRYAEGAARGALAQRELRLHERDRLSALRGPHHFFASTSRSASVWSNCSESSFLSREFSSSSSRSPRASAGPRPAYFSR